jgi:hypothetical protein
MYIAGLTLLGRQFKQEEMRRQQRAEPVKYDTVDTEPDRYDGPGGYRDGF